MAEMQITLPDGSVRPYESGVTGMDIAKSVSPRLAKEAIAVRVNGVVRDLSAPVPADAKVEILTFDDPDGRQVFWHSSSHIMAQAVQELFPGVKLAIGPSIDEGWYYDFDVEKPFSPEDIARIEERMQKIVDEDAVFSCDRRSRSEAIEFYRERGEQYKIELLEGFEDDEVSFYSQSSFLDLCRGPHIPRTGIVKSFKLTATSGAYWRGDEKRPMLQRIYGVSYPKKGMLEDYLHRMEEAKRRDHRVLGKQLELFQLSDEIGGGLVLWHPKGAIVRHEIESFWRAEHLSHDYDLVYSPHIANLDLWQTSGHLGFYSESMLSPMEIEGREFQLKPMNCPFHIVMYKSRLWSYRDLPLRWAELGTVYRYEPSGTLHGLMRVRGFTQDDAHHFVAADNVEEEIKWTLDFCIHILSSFGFSNYDIYLSTRPEKAVGREEDWVRAEASLRLALEQSGLPYDVDAGGGAFYGPKIDIKIKDALNRAWQCSTIQFDFNLPERFDLHYIDRDGQQKRPYMIHRALLGSIERFFGVLIEHYAGDFPLWLAPVQVKVLPITDSLNEYGRSVASELKQAGVRVQLDDRSEKVGSKIRDAELAKVPYMLVVGGREAEAGKVSVRKRGAGDIGVMPLAEARDMLLAEIRAKGREHIGETTG